MTNIAKQIAFILFLFFIGNAAAKWELYSQSKSKETQIYVDRSSIIKNNDLREIPFLYDYKKPRGPNGKVQSMIQVTGINCNEYTSKLLSMELFFGKMTKGESIGPLKANDKDRWKSIKKAYIHRIARETCSEPIPVPRERLTKILKRNS